MAFCLGSLISLVLEEALCRLDVGLMVGLVALMIMGSCGATDVAMNLFGLVLSEHAAHVKHALLALWQSVAALHVTSWF